MKSNPIIQEIKITQQQLTDLNAKLKTFTINSNGKYDIIKKYAGGVCLICSDFPTKKIIYDADGASVIERYCNNCFDKNGLS
jgi:hypothetical protein